MHISRFQLKLTLIFLLVLLVPAVLVTFLNRLLTVETIGMDVDRRVEAVLQQAAGIAYDIIEEAEVECRSLAEQIADDEGIPASFDSAGKLESLVTDIMPLESDLYVTILDLRTDNSEPEVRFSTSSQVQRDGQNINSDVNIPYSIIDSLKQDPISQFHQERDIVYGVAPIFNSDDLIGAAIVYQKLKQELLTNIVHLQTLLQAYAIRQQAKNLMWLGVVLLLLLLAITGAIFAAFLARSVTKPILNLVAGTREVARGNLEHTVEVKGKDEIAVLEESFNSMVAQLKASTERSLRLERLAAWRDIARRIAHEIKNPLTPIQLSMYRLRKNLGSETYNDIFQQSYDSITKEVENLRNMVTEFSQFARMPKPRKLLSSPNEIVQDAINLYTGLPDNVIINAELTDDLPQIMADRDQMRQVLHNLIGNAVEAMSDGGEICVKTRLQANDVVIIEVSDTGCGMSEEIRQKIFTPYFTTKEKGTGLGMVITAQTIEEHGGEIAVESEEGVGTKVTVKLKAAAAEIDRQSAEM